jgi:hypothetical protein
VSLSGKIIRLLLLLLILAGILPFIFPWQKPLLSWRSLSLPDLSDIKAKLAELPETPSILSEPSADKSDEPRNVTIYRWQDEQGGWHFSNEVPPQGTNYEQMSVDPDTNLLPGQQASPEQPAQDKESRQTANKGSSYTADELMQLKQKAEEAKKALEQRYQDQQQRLQQLR